MKLSHLSETLIGSEIVKLGGEIREKIRLGEKIYNFTVGDFDPQVFPIPAALEEEIIAAYRAHFTNYPLAEGNLDLRESIAAFIKDREGLAYDKSEYLVAAGGRPLIYAAFRALVDAGEKVVYAVPSWNNNHYTHFVGGEHVVVEAGPETNFMPSAASLEPLLKGATLLALCSPQNPTGTVFSKEELEKICDLVLAENAARGEQDKKLYVLYDQMYWHLTYGDIRHYNPVSLRPAMRDFTIFIDAISKVFAATGVRVGWSFGPAPIIDKMKAILGHVGAWAPMAEQKAVAKFLQQKEAIDDFLEEFKEAIAYRLRAIHAGFQELKAAGFAVDSVAPQAAIYLTIKVDLVGKQRKDGKLFESQAEVTSYLLDAAKLAVVPFYAFGAAPQSPWYRLSVGTCKKEEIPIMLEGLRAALV
ncbi:aminotransferase class I/II-fold pyridoxal phosphate-dependent enzyme [Flavihumibacter sp. CACIAM 22H1]|uniref:pyridoxal phosphate-dependent aminotransferase n=1 Tax=Flavihumibacter sp. CACIAM 22H1 TaxID=1812911 RepID=UPI0007A890F8|nr:aminotransferase class I/II-fold pyridoxal phosphate-dependent enzyme [Flavihumibacter sp. CACIAM 22H1]KYP14654.1 MAG: aminotransferase [Flavihumibacter sp. CACIAM 22H1]